MRSSCYLALEVTGLWGTASEVWATLARYNARVERDVFRDEDPPARFRGQGRRRRTRELAGVALCVRNARGPRRRARTRGAPGNASPTTHASGGAPGSREACTRGRR